MKRPKLSLFAIVSLLVLLGLGVWANLQIVHSYPGNHWFNTRSGDMYETAQPSPSDAVGWPTIPEGILAKRGTPTRWLQSSSLTHEQLQIDWIDDPQIDEFTMLREYRFGAPFTARSRKSVVTKDQNDIFTDWPTPGGHYMDAATTYHPLGLIANPIVYALPPWCVLLLVRLGLMRRRQRRRVARGLCPHCAYEVNHLPTCPECGHTP